MQKQFNLDLPVQAIDTVMKALSNLPYREVAALMAEIDRQVREQMQPAAVEAQAEA